MRGGQLSNLPLSSMGGAPGLPQNSRWSILGRALVRVCCLFFSSNFYLLNFSLEICFQTFVFIILFQKKFLQNWFLSFFLFQKICFQTFPSYSKYLVLQDIFDSKVLYV